MKPRIIILKTDGTNCDQETAYAFEKAGASAQIVHLTQLKNKTYSLHDFDIIALPGGFSYGDDIASGRVFALELSVYLQEELAHFVAAKKPIIGICNGFQVLVQLGLLPFTTMGVRQATLTNNSSRQFECRWIKLIIEESPCIFTRELRGLEITLPVAHAEGHFYVASETLTEIERQQLAVIRYSHAGLSTQQYPTNPNGSVHAIAGICNPTGTIFGLMPHPERYVEYYQLPTWRRAKIHKPHGLLFFEQAINYVK